MALLSQRLLRGLVPARFSADRPPARCKTPDRIVLGVKPGVRASNKAPVRIFLGTERGQFRAERAFLWSIEKHRDPSRIYEIHLLGDLKGFRRGFWLTGFTNYRFAIPALTGFDGRAIYNDADQVYLTDPAELFDLDMGKAGFLSINDRDTSVMLIDCRRMAQAWNEHDVHRLSRKALEARARKAGLWGDLDDGWNARDSEYDPGSSRLVHFTTLHTQPWRPFPDQFVYFDNPTRNLWPRLEREAQRAHFMPVSATRPSRDWAAMRLYLSSRRDGQELIDLLAPGGSTRAPSPLRIADLLERVPDQDVPWVLERLFRATGELEVVVREPAFNRAGRLRRSQWFWIQQFQQASRMHQQTRWTLSFASTLGRTRRVFCGGPAPEGSIAVLLHRKPGHNQQARAIGQELSRLTGRPVVEYTIQSGEAGFVLGCLAGSPSLPELQADTAIVIAGGWLPTRVARLLGRRRPGLRLILSGRKAGPVPEASAVVIQCRHFGLPPHPRRLLTTLPLNAGHTESETPSATWQRWLDSEKRSAVLIGGSSRSHYLGAKTARQMAKRLSAWAAEQNSSLLVVTSRRSRSVLKHLAAGLGPNDLLYAWRAGDMDNPYKLVLDNADQLVVTGESESMLADAASRGRGFLVWPLPERSSSPWRRFCSRVAERATRPRFNRRGSIRPQQGLSYLCARALDRNWILPPRRLDQLHQALYKDGLAAPFGETAPSNFKQTDELQTCLKRAADLLNIDLQIQSKKSENEKPHEQQRQPHS